jgi:CelD/BcsL family acetyltransferase involved in cellulose biosynthesis
LIEAQDHADAAMAPAVAPAPSRGVAPCRARPVALAAAAGDGALVAAWRALADGGTLPTQKYGFVNALAATLLREARVELLLVDGAQGLRALLPLGRARHPLARWRIPGACEVHEPTDALFAAPADPADAAALARALVAQGRALSFDRLMAASPLIPALRAALKGRGWLSVRPATPCPTIALDARWCAPESCFNAGRRSDFRRAARRAEEFGAVSYQLLSPAPDAFDALFDEAIGVEGSGWKQGAGTAIAADRDKEAFFRGFFRSACERGQCRIAFLRIDGQAVATQLALEWAGRFWLFKIGYDERFARCSPGTLLMLHSLGWAARRGLTAYELMGQIEPWITAFWTRDHHACVRLRTYPANLRGAAALAVDGAIWGAVWLRRRIARWRG